MVSDKNICSCFHYIIVCKTYDPRAEPFWPHGHNLNILVRGPLGDVTYKYYGFRPCAFGQEDLFMFSCKTCDPWGGPIFCPQGHYLIKLGRCSQDDDSDKKIFEVFISKIYF